MRQPFDKAFDIKHLTCDARGIEHLNLRRRVTASASFALGEQRLRYGRASNATVSVL
jgi:hypothetical protein